MSAGGRTAPPPPTGRAIAGDAYQTGARSSPRYGRRRRTHASYHFPARPLRARLMENAWWPETDGERSGSDHRDRRRGAGRRRRRGRARQLALVVAPIEHSASTSTSLRTPSRILRLLYLMIRPQLELQSICTSQKSGCRS
jgi:hypothetical protein